MKPVTEVRGVGPTLGRALNALGIETAAALARAAPETLLQVPRIGAARAPRLIAAAQELAGFKSLKRTDGAATTRTVTRKVNAVAVRANAAEPAEKREEIAASPDTEAKDRKKAKARAKAEQIANQKKIFEAKVKKAKEKIKEKSKKDKKSGSGKKDKKSKTDKKSKKGEKAKDKPAKTGKKDKKSKKSGAGKKAGK